MEIIVFINDQYIFSWTVVFSSYIFHFVVHRHKYLESNESKVAAKIKETPSKKFWLKLFTNLPKFSSPYEDIFSR
jgi:hypothetical protein